MSYQDLVQNVVVLGLLALAVAKVNEAVVGRLYDALFTLFAVPEDWQSRIRSTLFLWAEAMGVTLCVRASIPFMGDVLKAPDSYILAGVIVGAGAGVIWDVVLDKAPIQLSEYDLEDGC